MYSEYSASNDARRDNNDAVQERASRTAYRAFSDRLHEPPQSPDETVPLMAGGAGAGKSTVAPERGIVYDATLSDPKTANRNIQQVLDSGRRVNIDYVFNDPIEAFRQMLTRGNGIGCVVKLDSFIKTHDRRGSEGGLVDQGYTGEDAAEAARKEGIKLQVIKLPEAKKGFVLLPRRWVVERSFGWINRFRRLARDYERLPETLAGLHFVAFVILMLCNAARILPSS